MENQIGKPGAADERSRASSATNFEPDSLRLIGYLHGFVLKLTVWCFVLCGIAFAAGIFLWSTSIILAVLCFLASVILFVPAAFFAFVFFIHIRFGSDNFKNGLLTASEVVCNKSRRLVHIATLSNGGDAEDYVYGIRVIAYDAFPKEWLKNGQRLASVSTFSNEVPHDWSWHSFEPVPVVFGTNDERKINRCLFAVDEDSDGLGSYFDVLRRFRVKYVIPKELDGLYVCDVDGNLLETRSHKADSETPPPPLARQRRR